MDLTRATVVCQPLEQACKKPRPLNDKDLHLADEFDLGPKDFALAFYSQQRQ